MAQVTPLLCGPHVEYITLTSKVIELPSALTGSKKPTVGEAPTQSHLLWLLLLPLLVGAAVVIALGAFRVWRQYRLARDKPFIRSLTLATFYMPGVDLGSPASSLKQKYFPSQDLGAVSESNVDKLYHTSAALLSNHERTLGYYCHITVAWLPYTTLPDRLDLVPEKRYLLPEHFQPLLQTLLHGTTLPENRELALHSEAHSHFITALADAGKSHDQKWFAEHSMCGKLRSILACS
ncbi:hypothetical protein MTO96_020126 [Rhipicephalus appendiculatus]